MIPEERRKIEAYDAARAKVKREGFSRAEYVLRAEAAEARVEALSEALRQIAATESRRVHGVPWVHWIDQARAALACPPQQRGE